MTRHGAGPLICPCEKIEQFDADACKKSTINNTLFVIAVISNPVRFNRRYQLFVEFTARLENMSQVSLLTVELQHGERTFQTQSRLKLRTTHELWHKENLINIAIQHLPIDWKYVAWIDADIDFYNKDWAEETLHQLQHYKIVQLFSHAIDLGPKGECIAHHDGFVYRYVQGGCDAKKHNAKIYGGTFWHPGYAWACTREIFDKLGGLIDYAILGAADHHMSLAFIGQVEKSIHDGISSCYKKRLREFQNRCNIHLKANIGYVPGCILHHWHGRKSLRKYQERWQILINNKYDPDTDIFRDSQGIFQLCDTKPRLRDDLRMYFRARNEDSIDLE